MVFSIFFPVCWYTACGSVIGTHPRPTHTISDTAVALSVNIFVTYNNDTLK